MTSALDGPQESPHKGKARAQAHPTEHTPLLNAALPSSSYSENTSITQETTSRRLRSKLTSVFLVSLSICIFAFALAAVIAWSYADQVSKVSPDNIVKDAVVFRGPDRVDVLNITEHGEFHVRMDARLGLNAGSVLGVNKDPRDGLLQRIWKSMGRWGVRRLDRVTVSLSTIDLVSESDPSVILTSIDTQPITVPLTANPPFDKSWLTSVSTLLLIRPTNNTSALIHFLRDSWRSGVISIRADIPRALVRGGPSSKQGWRGLFHGKMSNVRARFRVSIPYMPGLPQPGHNLPFPDIEDLLTLKSLNISSESNNLVVRACATIIDPSPGAFNLTTPPIPFIISLPSISKSSSFPPIPVAAVTTSPFTLTHPNITLHVSGPVLPLAADSIATLSSFMTHFMSGEPNPIVISSPLVPGLSIETRIPAPNPPPHVLRNVTIHNMKIKPGNTFLASGTVFARVVLPKGINVGLNISRILPDVLIFDGEVPDSASGFPPPSSLPLPDPLPERAFGHIKPEDWLESLSVPTESEDGEGAAFIVTARIIDVPLEVLPGRQKEFSNFIGKVVFGSDGAIAGILGSAAVAVKVQGLPFPDAGEDGEMELGGLPFKGSVRIGKKSMFTGDITWNNLWPVTSIFR